MIHPTRFLGRGLFGGLVVAALYFGATQALASPTVSASPNSCSKGDAWACIYGCKEEFGSNYGGRCSTNVFGHVSCECYQMFAPSGS